MGTSTHYRDKAEEDAASLLAMSNHAQAVRALENAHDEHGDHDLARILRDIRDTLASARADIAELLRRAAPPNDHP